MDLLREFGPRRVIDTPIAEASFTGAGVGAAITGMRPVVEVLFVDFALLAWPIPIRRSSSARAGVDIATIPEGLFDLMFQHPLTEMGLSQFDRDWANVKKRD